MKKRHTPEQIVRKPREADAQLATGAPIPEVARQLGISEATFHRWRNQHGGMRAGAMKRLKELQKENARLEKKIAAEQAVDVSILKEVSRKELLSPTRRRAAVEHARRKLGVSERRARRAIGQPRSGQRYVARGKREKTGRSPSVWWRSRGRTPATATAGRGHYS